MISYSIGLWGTLDDFMLYAFEEESPRPVKPPCESTPAGAPVVDAPEDYEDCSL